MGLQTWPQSKLPLSSMACLDVEPPTICRVLQRRLQQRRTREQLVEQGIMPPLKIPVAFHEQIRSLERARTGNFLKHKLCSRPVRSELVRMHILQETQAEPSLQATQMKLKRARLADDLNDKISHRPGPMELVVKNILPVENSVKEVILEGKVNSPKTVDVYTFEEDSSDAIPPERPTRQAPQHSCSASPKEAAGSEAVSPSPPVNSATQQSSPIPQATSNSTNIAPEQQSSHLAKVPQTITTVTPTARGPFLVKQSQPKAPGDKSRSKKSKEPKPRVKKLKYHQYVPPDQKEEASEVPMDSAYARLLQQQQQFLQLQILSQQQQRYNYQAILPAPLCQGNNRHNSCSNVVPSRNGLSTMDSLTNAAPARPSQTLTNHTLAHLPANLEEMKVAELKLELKQRGLLVSGTKTDLIERLKSHGETSNIQPASTMDVAQTEKGLKLSPPVSPIVSKVSSLGLDEESATADGEASAPTPPGVSQEDSGAESRASEKDKRLREKECQIEELKRKLQREQSLVEELKMQLEVEKRSQQEGSSPRHSPHAPIQVKEENGGFSSCSASRGQAVIKQEEVVDQKSPPQQLFVGHSGPPILLDGPVSESAVTIHLPHNGVKFQATVSCVTPCLVQATGALPQKTETAVALEQHYALSRPVTEQTAPLRTFPVSVCLLRTNACEAMEDTPQHLNSILQSGGPAMASGSEDAVTRPKQKAKDPPRYEDAVKQSRSMQIISQVPTATSQHMDDLFDVLIESGEILPFIRQDPSCLDKLCPVTANVTSLPVNTALSRPPPHIQVACPPAPSLKATPGVVPPVTASHHLETLLEGTRHREPHEMPTTPTDGMELDPNTVFPFPFHLHSTHLDNMDWLDHTIPVAEEAASPLDVSFSADLLDSHVLQLHWA